MERRRRSEGMSGAPVVVEAVCVIEIDLSACAFEEATRLVGREAELVPADVPGPDCAGPGQLPFRSSVVVAVGAHGLSSSGAAGCARGAGSQKEKGGPAVDASTGREGLGKGSGEPPCVVFFLQVLAVKATAAGLACQLKN